MAGAEERLRCWAAGAEVQAELNRAQENSRHMLDLLQQGTDPNSSTTFRTEAANYRLHIGAVEVGVREAEACGETAIDLSWIGEFRRLHGMLSRPPSNEADAHSQFDALDSVVDWLRRDTAGIQSPAGKKKTYPADVTGTAFDELRAIEAEQEAEAVTAPTRAERLEAATAEWNASLRAEGEAYQAWDEAIKARNEAKRVRDQANGARYAAERKVRAIEAEP